MHSCEALRRSENRDKNLRAHRQGMMLDQLKIMNTFAFETLSDSNESMSPDSCALDSARHRQDTSTFHTINMTTNMTFNKLASAPARDETYFDKTRPSVRGSMFETVYPSGNKYDFNKLRMFETKNKLLAGINKYSRKEPLLNLNRKNTVDTLGRLNQRLKYAKVNQ
jgi:hypothetical protein